MSVNYVRPASLSWFGTESSLSYSYSVYFLLCLGMDAARAVAITGFPSPPGANEFEKMYPNFRDELDVLPNTATATAAIEQLVQGK